MGSERERERERERRGEEICITFHLSRPDFLLLFMGLGGNDKFSVYYR